MSSRAVHVAVLGGGSWGSTVASLAAANADTVLWARNHETVDEINKEHHNSAYLPDLPLHRNLRATADLEEAVWNADVVVAGVPSQAMRSTMETVAPLIRHWVPVVSISKGLEQGTRLRMTEVIDEVIPGHPVGTLAGPNIAREVLAGYAAAAVVAMTDEQVAQSIQRVFASARFRVYTNTDVAGCELGGALKNVIAIAVGMAEGLSVGDNTRAMVFTRGLAEILRLGVAMGGQSETFSGLTGVGDLMATCTSPHSRNRTVGAELAKGFTIEEIIASMNQVAEGVKTARVVTNLAADLGVETPIAREIDAVVNEGRTAKEAYRGLGRIQPGQEIVLG
ncbi:MAG: NAD(P)H-dependent glycerol-3-phosphate dehydrogenase [Acidimicrobiales bacterium]